MKDATYYRVSGFNPEEMKFDSTVIDRYMSGTVEMTGQYRDGIKEGDFFYFYPDQTMRLQSTYLNNNRSGTWIEYYQTGQVFKEVEYGNGREKLIRYNNPDGSSILKNHSGKFEMIYFYDDHFEVTAANKLNPENTAFLLSGKIKNGLKDGKWTLKSGLKRICQLNYREGNFILGKYFINNTTQNIKNDIFSYLILEPEKLKITDDFYAEPGQLIKENYLIRYIQQNRDRNQRKIDFSNATGFVNYFENQYSVYVKNCADTFRIKVALRIDADGKVSISSYSPNTPKAHVKEIERIVNTVRKIKSAGSDSIEINHRVICLDELSFKK